MSYVRCSRCQARRTLARKLDSYTRVPRCRRCGHNHYYVDKHRTTKERGKGVKACQCGRTGFGLYHFPHRRGGGMCQHNPKLTKKMMERWARERGLV